jgi:hypothetical protein
MFARRMMTFGGLTSRETFAEQFKNLSLNIRKRVFENESGIPPGGMLRVSRAADCALTVSLHSPLRGTLGLKLSLNLDFGFTKGMLGPSSNPSDEKDSKTKNVQFSAKNHQPCTKAGIVHLFLLSGRNFILLNDIGEQVTRSQISNALSFQNVPLYSDLLLHDMGSLGDGIVQGAAGATEMRTAPLWGLRGRTTFLHDGRAATISATIAADAGEATQIAKRFEKLPASDQQDRTRRRRVDPSSRYAKSPPRDTPMVLSRAVSRKAPGIES